MRREWIEMESQGAKDYLVGSPSMRREWIEMFYILSIRYIRMCLPPCGGSGLKCLTNVEEMVYNKSPSMRREWIEIFALGFFLASGACLPPCGGSGLKSASPAEG